MKLPHALEARINELVKSGFYSDRDEFIIEAVRLHLQSQKFKELERLSEKWINIWPTWPNDTWLSDDIISLYYPPLGPLGKTTIAASSNSFHL